MFAAVLADRGQQQPFCLQSHRFAQLNHIKCFSSIFVTEILASLLMHYMFFSNLNAFIKSFSSFVKDAMFVSINYGTIK